MTPDYSRQVNKQVVVINMKAIIDDIRKSYPHETFGDIAARIGVTTGTVKTWHRTNRARRKIADALVMAYPVPVPHMADKGREHNIEVKNNQTVPLSELFDRVIQGMIEIRERIGV